MLALACDHVGIELKEIIMDYLTELGIEYKDFGTYNTKRCNYPEFAIKAAKAVASGECDKGILFCGTGIGIGIAANKINGIRCVCCSDCYSAKLSREHNNSNMLSLGARVVGYDLAKMIVKSWLDGVYEGGRHQARIDQISSIEKHQTII